MITLPRPAVERIVRGQEAQNLDLAALMEGGATGAIGVLVPAAANFIQKPVLSLFPPVAALAALAVQGIAAPGLAQEPKTAERSTAIGATGVIGVHVIAAAIIHTVIPVQIPRLFVKERIVLVTLKRRKVVAPRERFAFVEHVLDADHPNHI